MNDKIRIGAHSFEVTYREMDDLCGQCDATNLTITINSKKPVSIQEETLLHEILHIIRELTGTDNKDSDKEEQEVQAQAHLLYQTLKENSLFKEIEK